MVYSRPLCQACGLRPWALASATRTSDQRPASEALSYSSIVMTTQGFVPMIDKTALLLAYSEYCKMYNCFLKSHKLFGS